MLRGMEQTHFYETMVLMILFLGGMGIAWWHIFETEPILSDKWIRFYDIETWARILLGIGILAYIGYFGVYTIGKHQAFHTYALDMGWQNQAFWSLINHGGDPQVTLKGYPFSHHAGHFQPFYYILAPFYWVYQSAESLLLLQTIAIASAALPIFLLAKAKGLHAGIACILGFVYLLYPATHGMNTYDFHGLVFMVPLLLFFFVALESRRTAWIWILFGLMLLVREDVPLVGVIVGLYVLFVRKQSGMGLIMVVLSVGYFIFALSMMDALGGGPDAGRYFELQTEHAHGLMGVFQTASTNIAYLMQYLFFDEPKLRYLLQIFFPVLLLPFLARSHMILLIAPLFILLLSQHTPHYELGLQYAAHIIPIVFYLTIITISSWKALHSNQAILILSILLLGAGILSNSQFGMILSKQFNGFIFPDQHDQIVHTMMKKIPPDVAVATHARYYPHLSSRETIYNVPNDSAEYILLDLRQAAGPSSHWDIRYRSWQADVPDSRKYLKDLLETKRYGVMDYRDGVVLVKKGESTTLNWTTLHHVPEFLPDSIPRYIPPSHVRSAADSLYHYLYKHRNDICILAIKDEGTRNLSPGLKQYIKQQGGRLDTVSYLGSYAAIMYKEKVISEQSSNSSAVTITQDSNPELKRLFKDRIVHVYSAGNLVGNRASIQINGKEWAPNRRGINLVVLDSKLDEIKAIYFDTWKY